MECAIFFFYRYCFLTLSARCRGVRRKSSDLSRTRILQPDTSFLSTCAFFSFFVMLFFKTLLFSVGNELTPSAKYDFKFKDYAPWVFRYLREDSFQLDPADYLLSLTAKYILSELGSPGKSGSFFYFSRDYRFIIKTIRHSEHKFLLSILKQYYAHVQENPHTLLSRFYGLHRVKLPHGRKIHFVIMNNLFPPHKDVHETYDLKGSTVGREYPEDKAMKNPRAVLKDLNWINRGNILELGPEKQALLTEQLRRDAEFLKTVYVMDYSLLVGIHNMQRGNKDNLRRNTLKVFSVRLYFILFSKYMRAGNTDFILFLPSSSPSCPKQDVPKTLKQAPNPPKPSPCVGPCVPRTLNGSVETRFGYQRKTQATASNSCFIRTRAVFVRRMIIMSRWM